MPRAREPDTDVEPTLQDPPEEPERVVFRPGAAAAGDDDAPTLTRPPEERVERRGAGRPGLVGLLVAVAIGGLVGLVAVIVALRPGSSQPVPAATPLPAATRPADLRP